ncbi:hypothetical protein PROFUN_02920 [Planoprotostelium fungivorum]|uniref:Uncharacterized protein n=1 Tax=Planoprotostelium fungivorum TaxID=1890364 RepID=A0A2P6NS42_9EUKA|nr:hypothetical protein PROFUN_02920 [Planoprotostelium fungivorum]
MIRKTKWLVPFPESWSQENTKNMMQDPYDNNDWKLKEMIEPTFYGQPFVGVWDHHGCTYFIPCPPPAVWPIPFEEPSDFPPINSHHPEPMPPVLHVNNKDQDLQDEQTSSSPTVVDSHQNRKTKNVRRAITINDYLPPTCKPN